MYQWEGSTDNTITAKLSSTWLDATTPPNKISLVAAQTQLSGLSYWISPDYVDFSYPALADADGTNRIYIEGVRPPDPPVTPGPKQVKVIGFTTSGAGVYDVRDPRHPVRITTTEYTSGALSFWDADLPGLTYYLSTEGALQTPAIELDTPSSWGTAGHTADYIAIVYRDAINANLNLWSAIDPLLTYRATSQGGNFRVVKVDVQDIYDEFNYGRRDPEAIRSFLSYAYHNWNAGDTPPTPPQYVLLVGSGTYDFTGVSSATKPNLIPPYMVDVDPWLGEVPADNRYVSIDGPDDFLPDMHIGRIPAQNPAQVTAAVDKTLAYEKTAPAGDWQKRVVYVSDECNNYADDFQALSENVRLNWLPASYDDRTVYYGNPTLCPKSNYSTAAGMTPAIKAEFNSGAFMVQWFGHGSYFRWGIYPHVQQPGCAHPDRQHRLADLLLLHLLDRLFYQHHKVGQLRQYRSGPGRGAGPERPAGLGGRSLAQRPTRGRRAAGVEPGHHPGDLQPGVRPDGIRGRCRQALLLGPNAALPRRDRLHDPLRRSGHAAAPAPARSQGCEERRG